MHISTGCNPGLLPGAEAGKKSFPAYLQFVFLCMGRGALCSINDHCDSGRLYFWIADRKE